MSQGRDEDQLPGVYRTGLTSWVRWWPLNNMDVCSISWVVGDSDICNVYRCPVWSQACLESSSCTYIRLAHLFFLWVKWQELPLGLAEKCWRNNSLCCCDHKYANLQITFSCETNIRNCTQDENFSHIGSSKPLYRLFVGGHWQHTRFPPNASLVPVSQPETGFQFYNLLKLINFPCFMLPISLRQMKPMYMVNWVHVKIFQATTFFLLFSWSIERC